MEMLIFKIGPMSDFGFALLAFIISGAILLIEVAVILYAIFMIVMTIITVYYDMVDWIKGKKRRR